MDFAFGAGYVLDFSNRTFKAFFGELGIDIEAPAYSMDGDSKGKRLRAVLSLVDDATAIRALEALWLNRSEFLIRSVRTDPVPNAEGRFLALLERLRGASQTTVAPPVLPVPPEGYEQDLLKEQLLTIRDMAPQARGYAFEQFLTRLFRCSGMAPNEPFRNLGEQIDGSFVFLGEVYLVEAKYERAPTGVGDLHAFDGKVRDKATWTRGLFVAFEGFTDVGLHAFGRGKAVVLMTGWEIRDMLDRRIPLGEVLSRKVRKASENGRPFNPLGELFKQQ
ncbi:restriction endonuclease [Muricoccus vinaceus]|uniref:Restriction endonuclease n=1 Tax=Muricoccus vinaceus TaxID=424704 RepID=A0ABV6IT30_9PROT